MKERGIIFNDEMVRAILEGRKTQTRRPVKPQPDMTANSGFSWNGALYGAGSSDRETYRNFAHVACPHGKPGDRIWVRETWQGPLVEQELLDDYQAHADIYQTPTYCMYAADSRERPEYIDSDDNIRHGWRPSVHMPRWASRITLEIIDVRVQLLQDISEEDAISEGLTASCGWDKGFERTSATEKFRALWKSIYGEENWDANPWVWVIEFKRLGDDK